MNPRRAAGLLRCTARNVRHLCARGVLRARRVLCERNQHGYEWSISEPEGRRYAMLRRKKRDK